MISRCVATCRAALDVAPCDLCDIKSLYMNVN